MSTDDTRQKDEIANNAVYTIDTDTYTLPYTLTHTHTHTHKQTLTCFITFVEALPLYVYAAQ